MNDPSNPYQPPSGALTMPAVASSGPRPGRGLDFGRCLTFFFQDPAWPRKLLIGSIFSLLSVLIVGGIFIAGYAVRTIRRAARGEPYPLPEWDDLGGMFVEGLFASGIYLGHFLPPFLLVLSGAAAVGLLEGGGGEPSPALAALTVAFTLVFSLIFVVIALYLPAAWTRFAVEERFGAGFEVTENLAFIQRNLSNYVLAILVYVLASFVSQVGLLLFCIGLFPASFWALSASAYALGEVAFRDSERQDAPPAPGAPS